MIVRVIAAVVMISWLSLPREVEAKPIDDVSTQYVVVDKQYVVKRDVSPEYSRSYARKAMKIYGWNHEQWKCLSKLWMKESNWNHKADNPKSSAYGIPQALPGNKMASAGVDWATNPITQINWGMQYIFKRYTNPCRAMRFHERHGFY